MNCKEINQLLLSYLDNEVSTEERDAIVAHLSACPSCREELEALASTQRELRHAFKVITARVSPSSYAWATIKQPLEREEHRRIPILIMVKSKVKRGIDRLRQQPVWQKALACALSVALIVGLCLTIPSLLGQSPEAMAENIALEDPGVQLLLAEKGFSVSSKVYVVAFKSDKRNIYYVHLMRPEDKTLIGIATVDVEEGKRRVIRIELTEASKSYTLRPSGLPEGVSVDAVINVARGNPEVRGFLDAGAEVSRTAYLSSPEKEFVGLALRQDDKELCLVKIDWGKREVVKVYMLDKSHESQTTAIRTDVVPGMMDGKLTVSSTFERIEI